MSLRRILLLSLLSLSLTACKHPLEISGQGDIVERRQGLRGCSLEESLSGSIRCTSNEVSRDESVLYQALPRPGWAFSHWQGCTGDSLSDTCAFNYLEAWASAWDENYPDLPGPALSAVFTEDSSAPLIGSYLSASFGSEGAAAFGALLETLVSTEAYYRHSNALANTRPNFDREPVLYNRRNSGLLYTANASQEFDIGGWATAELDLLALVDTDASDNEISVTWLSPQLSKAENTLFVGTYYCGRISTNGAGEFSRLIAAGNGTGVLTILEERRGNTGQAGFNYAVAGNGVMSLNWGNVSLTGSLSATGDVYVATQLQQNKRGSAVCIRANAGKTLLNVAGTYLGAWMGLQPVTAVTEMLIDDTGSTAESVHLDSFGGRAYSLGLDYMLVHWDGRIGTSSNFGAISGDGRVMFIVYMNSSGYPKLVYYTRKSA